MKKHYFLILAVIVAVFCYVHISSVGKEYVFVHEDFTTGTEITHLGVDEDSTGNVEILGWDVTDKGTAVRVRSVSPGKVYVSIDSPVKEGIWILYVHNNGVITNMRFFGDCTGADVAIMAIIFYLIQVIIYLTVKYFMLEKRSFYSYDNVLYLGLLIFALFLLFTQIQALIYRKGIFGAFSHAMQATELLVMVTLPVVIVTTVCVTVSNIKLIRKEGRTWRNMLGFFLGLALGIGAVLPEIIGRLTMSSPVFVELHNERSIGRFAMMFVEDSIYSIVAYLECILLGAIITGIKTARHIPKFDKDFIIINGCQIRKDGTLTPLLKARADRAIEFAKMQKERYGRPIVFVPSGGKGTDEVLSEGEAIKRYLLEQGIPERDILAETDSTTTEENFKFSYDLIRKTHGSDYFTVAFSTSNYHVFRSGMLAYNLGIRTEGIGAKTKSYFWINAFVREYIATIATERKTNIKVAGILLLINLIGTLLMYISEALL